MSQADPGKRNRPIAGHHDFRRASERAAPDSRFLSDICLRLVVPNECGYTFREPAQCPIFAVAWLRSGNAESCRILGTSVPHGASEYTDIDMRAPPCLPQYPQARTPELWSGGQAVVLEHSGPPRQCDRRGVFTINDSRMGAIRIGAGVYYWRKCDILLPGPVTDMPRRVLCVFRMGVRVPGGTGRDSPGYVTA